MRGLTVAAHLVWQDVFRALVDLALGLAQNGSGSALGHITGHRAPGSCGGGVPASTARAERLSVQDRDIGALFWALFWLLVSSRELASRVVIAPPFLLFWNAEWSRTRITVDATRSPSASGNHRGAVGGQAGGSRGTRPAPLIGTPVVPRRELWVCPPCRNAFRPRPVRNAFTLAPTTASHAMARIRRAVLYGLPIYQINQYNK